MVFELGKNEDLTACVAPAPPSQVPKVSRTSRPPEYRTHHRNRTAPPKPYASIEALHCPALTPPLVRLPRFEGYFPKCMRRSGCCHWKKKGRNAVIVAGRKMHFVVKVGDYNDLFGRGNSAVNRRPK